ncbi:MAG: hypothetical protein ACOYJW_00065 [Candidatus Omnitrophota bacterium]|jgi:hypothetical protein
MTPKISGFFPNVRVTALATVVFFLVTTTGWAAPAIRLSADPRAEFPAQSLADLIEIPSSLGQVTTRYVPRNVPASDRPESSPVTVIHIQDPHGQYEAQKNIRAILEHLENTYQVQTLFLEGGSGRLEDANLKVFKDPGLNREMVDILAREGFAGGPEMFLAERENGKTARTFSAYGVEDATLYLKNLETFRHVANHSGPTGKFFGRIRVRIKSLASRKFNPELKRYFQTWVFCEERPQEWLNRWEILKDYAVRHLALDLEDPYQQMDWPQAVRFTKLFGLSGSLKQQKNADALPVEWSALKTWLESKGLRDLAAQTKSCLEGKKLPLEFRSVREFFERFYAEASSRGFDFRTYPNLKMKMGERILTDEIHAPDLITEVERIHERILKKLAVTDLERDLIRLSREARLSEKLLGLQLVRADFREIQTAASSIAPGVIASRLDQLENRSRDPKLPDLDAVYEEALRFYEDVAKRDEAMLENMTETIRQRKISRAVLVTGGFHAEGIKKGLKEKGISFVTLAPKMSEIRDSKTYLDALKGTVDYLTLRSYLRPVTPVTPAGIKELFGNCAAGFHLASATVLYGKPKEVRDGARRSLARMELRYVPLARDGDEAFFYGSRPVSAGEGGIPGLKDGRLALFPASQVRSEARNVPVDLFEKDRRVTDPRMSKKVWDAVGYKLGAKSITGLEIRAQQNEIPDEPLQWDDEAGRITFFSRKKILNAIPDFKKALTPFFLESIADVAKKRSGGFRAFVRAGVAAGLLGVLGGAGYYGIWFVTRRDVQKFQNSLRDYYQESLKRAYVVEPMRVIGAKRFDVNFKGWETVLIGTAHGAPRAAELLLDPSLTRSLFKNPEEWVIFFEGHKIMSAVPEIPLVDVLMVYKLRDLTGGTIPIIDPLPTQGDSEVMRRTAESLGISLEEISAVILFQDLFFQLSQIVSRGGPAEAAISNVIKSRTLTMGLSEESVRRILLRYAKKIEESEEAMNAFVRTGNQVSRTVALLRNEIGKDRLAIELAKYPGKKKLLAVVGVQHVAMFDVPAVHVPPGFRAESYEPMSVRQMQWVLQHLGSLGFQHQRSSPAERGIMSLLDSLEKELLRDDRLREKWEGTRQSVIEELKQQGGATRPEMRMSNSETKGSVEANDRPETRAPEPAIPGADEGARSEVRTSEVNRLRILFESAEKLADEDIDQYVAETEELLEELSDDLFMQLIKARSQGLLKAISIRLEATNLSALYLKKIWLWSVIAQADAEKINVPDIVKRADSLMEQIRQRLYVMEMSRSELRRDDETDVTLSGTQMGYFEAPVKEVAAQGRDLIKKMNTHAPVFKLKYDKSRDRFEVAVNQRRMNLSGVAYEYDGYYNPFYDVTFAADGKQENGLLEEVRRAIDRALNEGQREPDASDLEAWSPTIAPEEIDFSEKPAPGLSPEEMRNYKARLNHDEKRRINFLINDDYSRALANLGKLPGQTKMLSMEWLLGDEALSDFVQHAKHLMYEGESYFLSQVSLSEYIRGYFRDILAFHESPTPELRKKLIERYKRFALSELIKEHPRRKLALLHGESASSWRVVVEGQDGDAEEDSVVIEPVVYQLKQEMVVWDAANRREKVLPGEKIVFARWKGQRFLFYTSITHGIQNGPIRAWRMGNSYVSYSGWIVKETPENLAELPVALSKALDDVLAANPGIARAGESAFIKRAEELGFSDFWDYPLLEEIQELRYPADIHAFVTKLTAFTGRNFQIREALEKVREKWRIPSHEISCAREEKSGYIPYTWLGGIKVGQETELRIVRDSQWVYSIQQKRRGKWQYIPGAEFSLKGNDAAEQVVMVGRSRREHIPSVRMVNPLGNDLTVSRAHVLIQARVGANGDALFQFQRFSERGSVFASMFDSEIERYNRWVLLEEWKKFSGRHGFFSGARTIACLMDRLGIIRGNAWVVDTVIPKDWETLVFRPGWKVVYFKFQNLKVGRWRLPVFQWGTQKFFEPLRVLGTNQGQEEFPDPRGWAVLEASVAKINETLSRSESRVQDILSESGIPNLPGLSSVKEMPQMPATDSDLVSETTLSIHEPRTQPRFLEAGRVNPQSAFNTVSLPPEIDGQLKKSGSLLPLIEVAFVAGGTVNPTYYSGRKICEFLLGLIAPETVSLERTLAPEKIQKLQSRNRDAFSAAKNPGEPVASGGTIFMDETGLLDFASYDPQGFFEFLNVLSASMTEGDPGKPLVTGGDQKLFKDLEMILKNKNAGLTVLQQGEVRGLMARVLEVVPAGDDPGEVIRQRANRTGWVALLSNENLLAGLPEGANFAFKNGLDKENARLIMRSLLSRMRVLASLLHKAPPESRAALLEQFEQRQLGGTRKSAGGYVFDDILALAESLMTSVQAVARSA